MNKKVFQENLKAIIKIPSVSGFESEVSSFIVSQLKKEKIKAIWNIDTKGNLIIRKGKNFSKLAIVAHMDKFGFYVVGNNKNYLQVVGVRKLSKLSNAQMGKVYLQGGDNKGIYGTLKNKGKKNNNLRVYLKNTESFPIGTPVIYSSELSLKGEIVKSAYLDNSLGVCSAIEILKTIDEGTIIFSSQEEAGFLGVSSAIHMVKPSKVIVLDTTYDSSHIQGVRLHVGSGPSICIKDAIIADKSMVKELTQIALKKHIPFQIELWEAANSDAISIHQINGGIPTCFVGLPIKNPETPNEIGSLADANNVISLISNYFKSL